MPDGYDTNLEACPICTSVKHDANQEWVKLQCGHMFHTSCMSQWNKNCPMCRQAYIVSQVFVWNGDTGNLTEMEQKEISLVFHQNRLVSSVGLPDKISMGNLLSVFRQYDQDHWSIKTNSS